MVKDEIVEQEIPRYDSIDEKWKLKTDWGEEEGDAIYIAGEFVKGGLYYPFHTEPKIKDSYQYHVHAFSEVVEFLFKRPKFFSLWGFERFYSEQEMELLEELRVKLNVPGEDELLSKFNSMEDYNVFEFLSVGGWNECPSADEMFAKAKEWQKKYTAEVEKIAHDTVYFKINRKLRTEEVETLITEIEDFAPNSIDRLGMDKLKYLIQERLEFFIWWD